MFGKYKFAKHPAFTYEAFRFKDVIVLTIPFTFISIKMSQAQFNGALWLGHLDRVL